MAEKDVGSDIRRRRVRLLKKLIVIVPLSAILILLTVCIILGVRLHMVTGQLRVLQEQVNTMSEAATEADARLEAQAPDTDTDTDTGGGLSYTVSAVDVSKEADEETAQDTPQEEAFRRVYLTFDDGPSSNTDRILDILAAYDVKATFFVVGKEEEEYRALYNRIVEEGHTLAMHSYSHKYSEVYQSVDSFAEDLSRLQEFLYDTTGVWCRYYRFPGGSSNTVSDVDMHELIAYLDGQDMMYFDWNISSGDASSSYISPDDIISNCMGTIRNFDEAMILMHDASNKDSTVEALPALIEQIQALEDTKIVPVTDDTGPIHHISND